MIGRLAAVLLAASLLTGCLTLEPAYHRPSAPVPSQWPTGPAYGAPAPAPPISGWRDVFLDAKLRAVIDEALVNNRDLRLAIAQIEQARAQYHVQGAALFPTVSASAGATYAHQSTSGFGRVGSFDEHQYTAELGFTSYELDLFGRVRSLSKAAREAYLASEAASRSTRITLIAEVAADYLTYAADLSLLAVAEETATSGAATLRIAQQRLDGGIGTGLDVSSAATVVEQAKSDIARYTTQIAQDRNALELVVGAPVAAENLPTGLDDRAMRIAPVPVALTSNILLRRPDVLQAEHTLRSANANIGAARAAFFPSISLTGDGGTTSPSLGKLFAAGTGIYSFAPNISVPIFDGGRNKGNLDYARAQDRADIAAYEKAIQTAFREVADALAAHGTFAERIRAGRALVAAAENSLRLSEALYERGSGNYLDVLTAQRILYAARQALISTMLIGETNGVTLYKVLGGGYAE